MALENKLGIENSAELAREEEKISKKKAISGLHRLCIWKQRLRILIKCPSLHLMKLLRNMWK